MNLAVIACKLEHLRISLWKETAVNFLKGKKLKVILPDF